MSARVYFIVGPLRPPVHGKVGYRAAVAVVGACADGCVRIWDIFGMPWQHMPPRFSGALPCTVYQESCQEMRKLCACNAAAARMELQYASTVNVAAELCRSGRDGTFLRWCAGLFRRRLSSEPPSLQSAACIRFRVTGKQSLAFSRFFPFSLLSSGTYMKTPPPASPHTPSQHLLAPPSPIW